MDVDPHIEYKILLLGDTTVGKTSLLVKYLDNKDYDNASSTIGVDVRYKDIVKGDKRIRLQYLDTAGQERFKSLANNYLNGMNGALLVFDITKKDTLKSLKFWIDAIKEKVSNENVELIVVENKIDLENEREITKDSINDFGIKHNFEVLSTSAKTGQGVEEAFNHLIDKLINNKNIGIEINAKENNDAFNNRKKTFQVKVNDNNSKKSNKKKCEC